MVPKASCRRHDACDAFNCQQVLALSACNSEPGPVYASMKRKHRRTLEAVFADPVSGTIVWADIESLLVAAGCNTIEGQGSRVRFVLGERILIIHRPHPQKEAKRYQVSDVRTFLNDAGVKP